MYTIVYETYLEYERQKQYEEIVNESITDTFKSIGSAIGRQWKKFIEWLGKVIKWIGDRWNDIRGKWKNRKKKKTNNTSSEDVINNPTEYTPEEVKEAIYEEVERVNGEVINDDEYSNIKNKNDNKGIFDDEDGNDRFSNFANSFNDRYTNVKKSIMKDQINAVKSALSKIDNNIEKIIRRSHKDCLDMETSFSVLLDLVEEYVVAVNNNDLNELETMKDKILSRISDFEVYNDVTLDKNYIFHNLSDVSQEELKKYVDAYFKSTLIEIIEQYKDDITTCINLLNKIYDLLKDFEPAKNDEAMSLVIKLVNKNTIGLQNILKALG